MVTIVLDFSKKCEDNIPMDQIQWSRTSGY
jgi:hypothetical protein